MTLVYTISIRINESDYKCLEELQNLLFLDNTSETIRQLIRRTKIDPKEQWENVLWRDIHRKFSFIQIDS